MPVLTVLGDTCPIGRNQPLFLKGDGKALLNDLAPVLAGADLVFANLEGPLLDSPSPRRKTGPVLDAPSECVKGIKAMGVDLVGLANNHIMDHGDTGLRSTLSVLRQNGIPLVGAGEDLAAASEIYVKEIQGIRVGIMALAENGFESARRTSCGVNPLDPVQAVRGMEENKSRYDVLVAILHGGNEYYPFPRPGLSSFCRFLVERGCQAVICQHSHCVGSMEVYHGKPIVYGQGNFIFDYPVKSENWNEGLIIELRFSGKNDPAFNLIPIMQHQEAGGVRAMTSEEKAHFWAGFKERSSRVTDLDFLERQWIGYCTRNKRFFLHRLHGKPSLLRRVIAKLDLMRFLDSMQIQVNRKNLVECESYREALVTALGIDIDERRN